MRHPHPGQNQEATLIGHEMEILTTDLNRPADKAVPATNVAGCRTIDHTGHRPLPGKDQILQVLSHRLAITQIVILLDQAVAELLKGRTPHLTDLKGENRRKRTLDRMRVNDHRGGFFSVNQGIERIPFLGGKLNITGPLQAPASNPGRPCHARPRWPAASSRPDRVSEISSSANPRGFEQ